ncbi:metal ABC transporter permease [bacterium]|nr:metal ABC transporter permease [bacterium]
MWEIVLFLLPPFVICTLMVFIFGYLGIHVLEREIIFIDIALAQIAAVGSTLAFMIWGVEEHHLLAYLCAFALIILAAGFYTFVGKWIWQISQETVIGVSYAIAAAGALFLLALHAGGDVHAENMLTGSILWAQWSDILLFSIVCSVVGSLHFIFRKRFQSVTQTIHDGRERDKMTSLWDFIFYISMGVVITLMVRVAGILVIFSLLIIPATFAAMFFRDWNKRLIAAWIMGIVASIAGLAFSYGFDFSCGPSVVSFLVVILIAAAIAQKCKRVSS